MSIWVLSSNPTTTYRAEDSLHANGVMDWIARNNFEIGDTVYIYEVLPRNGRGGIVFRTIVTKTGLSLGDKIDDREFWIGGSYPNYITNKSSFNKLKLIGVPRNGIIPYRLLKAHGFFAPQVGANSLDNKPSLLSFIRGYFD